MFFVCAWCIGDLIDELSFRLEYFAILTPGFALRIVLALFVCCFEMNKGYFVAKGH